jgi:alanyl-tRNA synthetase
MKAAAIRSTFLSFFESKGHAVVASSPVVPGDDPTLLFTNAGMNQFKDVFLGFDKRPYSRAATAQKCIRAGGKHNDLENVGYTARHLTFFEMLGNFSFGDYFKHDAIRYAWELLTVHFKLPKERLWATVYAEDDEAYDIWLKAIGLPAERIVRIGDNKGARYMSDNFWMMGDTGPCGPCSEIFYDYGPSVAGGPPGSPDQDGDRYVEIWNNVFMQFNRTEDGVMHKLPKPSVDTGMGLERLSSVLQGVHSVFAIDLFQTLIDAAKRAVDGAGAVNSDRESPSLKVIADHIRSCAFTVADGVIPGNEGRGYVLRRIARRAIRHGYKLGARKPFFHALVATLAAEMGDAYPEIRRDAARVTDVLKQEEERFFRTIAEGMLILDAYTSNAAFAQTAACSQIGAVAVNRPGLILGGSPGESYIEWKGHEWPVLLVTRDVGIEEFQRQLQIALQTVTASTVYLKKALPGSGKVLVAIAEDAALEVKALVEQVRQAHHDRVERVHLSCNALSAARKVDGELAFKLHDTYGFPLDLTADVCRERGVTVDEAGFNAAMQRQREQARAAGKFKLAQGLAYSGADTTFDGYEHLVVEGAKVVALYVDGAPVPRARAGDDVVVVLDRTPFYAESGGQVGDAGELRNASTRVLVEDTTKVQAAVHGHEGRVLEGEVAVGDVFTARVDAERRAKTVRNHSATHLMHKALRDVLGAHVQQKGSLVNAERTRFDFSHNAPLTAEQIGKIEAQVNAEILANAATQARVMAIDDAQKLGAMMLFGEKYGETVRVLDIGASRELCGGTHVQRTGDIGLFKVVAEGGIAAGVRRIEAVTGSNALTYLQSLEGTVEGVAASLKVTPAEVGVRVTAVLDQVRALEKEVTALKGRLASSQGDELIGRAVDVGGIKVLAATLDGADAKALRETMDKLKSKLKSAAIVLAAVEGGKVQLAAGVTADSTGKVKAGELVNFVAQQVGGKGGGKPDLAMAGGSDAASLPKALASVQGFVAERV